MNVPSADTPHVLRIAADADAANWVDALAAQECTPDEFIAEIIRLEREDAEVGWEALALLDQHFRREKLSYDVFITVKSKLQQHSVSSFAGAPPTEPTEQAVQAATAPTVLPARSAPTAAVAAASPLPATSHTALPGQVRMGDQLCGRYRVVDILRRDATGTLIEALDEPKVMLTGIRTRVAIQLLDETGSRAPDLLPRLGKLQQLSHPAIVRLLDVEEHGGALLLVMELVNGTALPDLLARKAGTAIDVTLVRTTVRAVASALSYAHSQGVTHGAVGAMNVTITPVGDAFLQNFQLQALHPAQPAADRLAFAWFAYELLTRTRSPERALDRNSRLLAPPGITREQWRVLRDTLTGKDGAHGNVLTVFAGGNLRAASPALASQRDGATPTKRTGSMAWIAAGLVTAALASVAHFFPTETRQVPYGTRSVPIMSVPAAVPAAVPAVVPAVVAAVVPPATAAAPAEKATNRAQSVRSAQRPNVPPPTAPGRPSIDLPASVTWVKTTAPVARIWVRRRGDLNNRVAFQWWTENGSALPDRDFRRISAREAIIPSGARGTELLVPLLPDAARGEARTFYVKIDSPSSRARLGARTLIQVAIIPTRYPAQISTR